MLSSAFLFLFEEVTTALVKINVMRVSLEFKERTDLWKREEFYDQGPRNMVWSVGGGVLKPPQPLPLRGP